MEHHDMDHGDMEHHDDDDSYYEEDHHEEHKEEHHAWMHEFKAWQMEYGDAEIDWDHYDHHDMGMDMGKEDYDKPVRPTGMPDMGGDMGDMQWILDFIGNENMPCPIFNIFIDESWGLGTAKDWEMGCRRNIQLTNQWMAMFDGSNDWQDTASLAHATCDMLLSALNDFAPGANLAGDMCNCMMENILAVGFSGNVDMSMLGGAMDCINKTQEFISMVMMGTDMDKDHDMDDHDMDEDHGSGDHDDDEDEDHDDEMEDHDDDKDDEADDDDDDDDD